MADYLPFDARPFRLRMGVRPLDLAHWLEPDEHRDDELALKAQLVAERYDDVVAIIDRPEVHAASDELWSLVSASLPTGFVGQPFRPTGGSALQNAIVRCGLATQEDWCLLVELEGALVLAAACVCFPTRWVLRDKLGLGITAVHGPVAFYEVQLSSPVDTFLDRLTVEHPVWRLNWNLMDDPALFQPRRPEAPGPDQTITEHNIGDRVWLRVERQTLRRLPETQAIAFSIRVHQRPLSALADRPDVLETLQAAVAALPPETYAYKDLGAFGEALDPWLQKRRSSFDSMPRNSS